MTTKVFDKNIILVGGASGIGLATCKKILQQKPKVIYNKFCSIHPTNFTFGFQFLAIIDKSLENTLVFSELQALSPKTRLLFFKCDLSHGLEVIKTTFDQILKIIPQVDVLVNCAGICNENIMDLTIQVNLIGTMFTSSIMSNHWDKRKGGRGGLIVNIASVAAFSFELGIPAYSASKAGVLAFSKSLAVSQKYVFIYVIVINILFLQELEPLTGVKVSIICPSATDTPLVKDVLSSNVLIKQNLIKLIPLQSAEDCAAHIFEVIGLNQNGGIFIVENGKMKSIELAKHWEIDSKILAIAGGLKTTKIEI